MGYAKSEDTRRKLVRTTGHLLRTQGYAATGMNEVIAQSGVPKGSLYHHFPGGKEELASAALAAAGDFILRQLHSLVDDAGSPADAVSMFCAFYVHQLQESSFAKGCPLATVALEEAGTDGPVRQSCGRGLQGIVQFFAELLLNVGVDVDKATSTSQFVVSSVEGAILLSKATHSTEPLIVVDQQLRRLLHTVLEGA